MESGTDDHGNDLDEIFSPTMSDNFPEEDEDPAYVNMMMTKEEVLEKKKQEELEAFKKQEKEWKSHTLTAE